MVLFNRVLDECESTNDLARAIAESGAPALTWIAARTQTRGRGRSGRDWISPPGNLHLSVILRPERAPKTWVPLAAAVAARRALEPPAPLPPIRLKWPNDLWIQGRKLAGILCEGATDSAGSSYIVMGIGANLVAAPAQTQPPGVSLLELGVSRAELALEAVIAKLLGELALEMRRLESGDTRATREEYERASLLSRGDRLAWTGADGAERSGEYLGLGDSGELLARSSDGAEARLISEEVRIRPAR